MLVLQMKAANLGPDVRGKIDKLENMRGEEDREQTRRLLEVRTFAPSSCSTLITVLTEAVTLRIQRVPSVHP